MNFQDDVERVVWRRVQHLVEGESCIVHDMVQLSVLPSWKKMQPTSECLRKKLDNLDTYLIVASMILLGKSSAETSPPMAMASPPALTISSTTSCAFFSSKLKTRC